MFQTNKDFSSLFHEIQAQYTFSLFKNEVKKTAITSTAKGSFFSLWTEEQLENLLILLAKRNLPFAIYSRQTQNIEVAPCLFSVLKESQQLSIVMMIDEASATDGVP